MIKSVGMESHSAIAVAITPFVKTDLLLKDKKGKE